METHVGAGQSAETAADRYATSLKPVNDWRQSQAAEQGGDYFRCPRCNRPRFVSAASKPDGVLFCSRARTTPLGLSDASQRRSAGLSDASQGRRACTFAARARKWRALPKAGTDGDGPRRRTVLDMLGAVARLWAGSGGSREEGAAAEALSQGPNCVVQESFGLRLDFYC